MIHLSLQVRDPPLEGEGQPQGRMVLSAVLNQHPIRVGGGKTPARVRRSTRGKASVL